MPAGRIGLAICALDGKIYVPGGGGIHARDAYSETYVYDPSNDKASS